MIIVKVIKLGDPVVEVPLNGDRTVDTAVEVAGFSSENMDIKVNNVAATAGTVLNDGDRVTLVPPVKGGN